MNEHLLEMFARDAVAQLPIQQQHLYHYIVQLEDQLAQQSDTAEQFLELLKKDSPYLQAAEHFGLSQKAIVECMKEIEEEIDSHIKMKSKSFRLLDCTDLLQKSAEQTGKQKAFLLATSKLPKNQIQ
ncbi:hypothetical protein [Pseudalkalibacillus sp. SCS-8]|uniref:hypothetical protein n=1 Tax=Pseudalkalibacillus nanhaiensis TaxID=3115291 RepID=UPI0032DBE201